MQLLRAWVSTSAITSTFLHLLVQGMSPEQLAAVSRQQFTPGQAASSADLARTAEMLQVLALACHDAAGWQTVRTRTRMYEPAFRLHTRRQL
jgi:hypothetical protein